MTQCSGQVGTLGQCTLPQEPGGLGPLVQGTSSWEPEVGQVWDHVLTAISPWSFWPPWPWSHASRPFRQMKTGSGAGSYPGATQFLNGPSKTCVCTVPLTAHNPDSPPQDRS